MTKFSSSRSDPRWRKISKMCWCRLLASNNGNTQTDSLLPTRAFSLLLKGSQEGVPAPPWSWEVQQESANVDSSSSPLRGAAGFRAARMCQRHAECDQVEVGGGEQVITVTRTPPRGKPNPNRETQQRRNADQHGKWGAGELMRLMEGGGGGRRGRKKKTGNDQHKTDRTRDDYMRSNQSKPGTPHRFPKTLDLNHLSVWWRRKHDLLLLVSRLKAFKIGFHNQLDSFL